MKKFYLIDNKIPVRTEKIPAGYLCLGLTLLGWRFVIEFYDMINHGSCRGDDFSTCTEVTEEEFDAAVIARLKWFADCGYEVSF